MGIFKKRTYSNIYLNRELLLLVVANMIFISALRAQEKIIYPHKSFWSKTEATQIFENKWGLGIDYIFRSNNEMNKGSIFSKWHRHSIRPWVHYQFDKNLRISISPIGFFSTQEYFAKPEDYNRQTYQELRTTLQVLHHHKMMGEKFTHTFRHWYEFRYRNPFDQENYFAFSRYRMRYRLRYLINKDYYNENKVVYAYASNEVMINYGRKIVYNMFSQNRIQLAVGYRIHPSTRLEFRYMNRFRSRPSGFEYDNTQATMLCLFVDQVSSLFGKEIRPVKYFD
jgi:hypothetical protein